MRNSLLFLKKFFLQPLANASLRPTHDRAVRNLCASIDWKGTNKKVILELWPGTGSVTKHILEKMSDDCLYYGIEFDSDYIDILREKYGRKNVSFIQGDVADIRKMLEDRKIDHVDIIVSTLPFNVFRDSPQLISYIQESTKKGVQYRGISYAHPSAYDIYKVLDWKIYSFTLLNLPPLYVLWVN
jgi:phospholipid N-methyltransferase